jgi:hypothetical protein
VSTWVISFDQAVNDRDRVRVMLELDVGSEPIVGSLQADGRRLDFSGWVGLATALEEAILAAADGSPGWSAATDAESTNPRRLS